MHVGEPIATVIVATITCYAFDSGQLNRNGLRTLAAVATGAQYNVTVSNIQLGGRWQESLMITVRYRPRTRSLPLTESVFNRREFVFGVAGAAAAAWLSAHASELHAMAAYAASVESEAPYEVLTPDQARDLDAFGAQIVPTDDTPGAREAHVVRFIDRAFATAFKDLQPKLQNDLKLLGDAVAEKTHGSRSFAALTDADQIAVMTAFEKASPRFNGLRNLIMLGMFSDPIHGGNFHKVGWKLIGFEDRYSWVPPFGYYDRF